MKPVLKVCIPNTRRDHFDYYADNIEPPPGSRVWVSFRKQIRLGIIVGKGFPDKADVPIKTINTIIDHQPLIPADLLTLCQWVSSYYQSPLSEVLSLALPKKIRQGEIYIPAKCQYFKLKRSVEEACKLISARAIRQKALIDFLASYPQPVSRKFVLENNFTSTQLKALADLDIVSMEEQIKKPWLSSIQSEAALELNSEQEQAVMNIAANLQSHQCYLLQGVTGSGKTEVYLQVIAKVLAAQKQVLVLVPEIGLTPQLLSRFQARFDVPIAILHSNLSDSERQLVWQSANNNEIKLVIGTRTSIFTPLPTLGLIVLDEEHDTSFKQMEGVRYSARDTALMRAYLANIPVILGSATPSLESLHNSQQGKYHILPLTQKALKSSPLHFQILDIRNQPLVNGMAQPTLSAIRNHLQQGHQVLVFINRRGYAPVLLCHQCGWMADCRACDSHATIHRRLGKMVCHHCGLVQLIPKNCPTCKSHELLPIGTGTQRIHEILASEFPSSTIIRIDRDEIKHKDQLNQQLERIHNREAQLIVGTQMLAKGHHFPRLTLVVVLDADNGFYNQDFRSLERLGQLLIQVAGRAGRSEWPGEVLIQTHVPQHPALNILIQNGYSAFAESLLSAREHGQLPPYHFLAMIRAQAKTSAQVLQFLHKVKAFLPADITILGPAPAPLARKSNQQRMQLLLKSFSRKKLQHSLTILREWLTIHNTFNGVRWSVDVDPMDLS